MNMSVSRIGLAFVLATTAAVVGCAAEDAEPELEAPSATDDALEQRQVVYSGAWSATALQPALSPTFTAVRARATFTGPGPRRMGVCLLKKWQNNATGANQPCNTEGDCTNYPVTLPPGGHRYCTWDNGAGTGQKYCFFRQGPQSTFCGGSPALGGSPPPPVAPGTLQTPWFTPGGGQQDRTFISYGCFEACLNIDPSSSSTTLYVPLSGGN
jgi:hypothetical protein